MLELELDSTGWDVRAEVGVEAEVFAAGDGYVAGTRAGAGVGAVVPLPRPITRRPVWVKFRHPRP